MSGLLHPAGSLATDDAVLSIIPQDAGWRYAGLTVVDLEPGVDRAIVLEGVEACVVPLRGGPLTAQVDDASFELCGRTSVFEGISDVAFAGLGAILTLHAAAPARVAICTSVAEEPREAFRRPASDISVDARGAGQATRQITGLLSADVDGPQRLIVVEVLTPAGNWSSYPPHKHDEYSSTEVPIEEIYHFGIAASPSGVPGFGLHRTYTTDGELDETVTVKDGDTFLIPRGYHGPCVAAPGYDMYYLNVMAGPDPERRWLICNDPAHDWVVGTWEGIEQDPRVPLTRAAESPQAGTPTIL